MVASRCLCSSGFCVVFECDVSLKPAGVLRQTGVCLHPSVLLSPSRCACREVSSTPSPFIEVVVSSIPAVFQGIASSASYLQQQTASLLTP